ncbi:MAG: autotransporter serine protease fusolisin [Fusobacterium sp.]|uniref:autotransporter serine protease fusolisin n=1 Tax=Fusobacterium sp. TaxID=68766 RepID=UPI0026DC8C0C|nr:autotransporter serine protease fusolisin [Fusobacterium sp.]MDO4690350.1 autotransporter serine protease fusolisin [Fusobacterium sp.]
MKNKKRKLKEQMILAAAICLVFTACGGGGGGGGGGGSTNLPIRPEQSVPSVPKKNMPDNASVPNEQNKGHNPALPNAPEGNKGMPDINNNDLEPRNPNVIPLDPKIPMQGSFMELRKKLGEEGFKNALLAARSKSTEAIPTDSRHLNGSTQKVAVLDSNFSRHEAELRKKYPQLEIVKTGGNNSEHGEEVLFTLMENGAKFKPILAGIGRAGTEGEISLPTKELYEQIIGKMENQKIKVFNQSFAVVSEMINFKSDMGVSDFRVALSGKSGNIQEVIKDGEELVKFYEKEVNNNTIFVWANGNTISVGGNTVQPMNAFLNPGLPKFRSELEKGWITAVGIQEKNDNGELNIHYRSHLAYPGAAKWWAISANAKTIYETKIVHGSSYAAPRVSRAAALVAEKFPWMTNEQVRQTLFTTTDRTEISSDIKGEDRRNIFVGQEPDYKYGWGMLNTERALKGPGSFVNTLSQYKHSANSNNMFNANVPEGITSYFENDIYGNGGLNKLGKGTLHLTGNNSYLRGSTVTEGTLEIHKIHAEKVTVNLNGELKLHSKSIIGYRNDIYMGEIDENDIKPSNIASKNVENYGTVKFLGSGINIDGKNFKGTAIIGGDYIAHPDSKTELDFSSEVAVLGNVNINGKVQVLSDKYIAGTVSKTLMSAKEIKGSIENVSTEGMRVASVEANDGKLVAELSRQNPVDYIGNAEESSKNVAQNVENVFADLDQKVKAGTASQEELTMAATMQSMSTMAFTRATEMMSGEIYASAQALTFSQAQNINRDLSNRLAGLGNLKLSNGESQAWFSAIGSDGKLRRDGYASADTRVTGGQFGLDKKFNSNTNLGVALAYSYAKADFNRYAGNSKSDMVGISLYGKKDLANNFYTAGRVGISHVSTKVERELIDGLGNTVQGRVKHDDIMSSVYLEVGKKFGWLTPFIGYSQDYLKRGSFSESNAAWGIHADSKNYWSSNFLVGLRAEFALNKYKFQSYVTQAINVGKRELTYEGHFTGNTTKQKYRGVKQAKNTTWLGVGLFREITPNFGIYGNVDFRVEDGKRADSVFSAGLQYKF